jgi:cysteine-rich repeat protein
MLTVLTIVPPAEAQVVTVPAFTAGSAVGNWGVQSVDTAASDAGEVLVVWQEFEYFASYKQPAALISRRFSAAGQPLGSAIRVEDHSAQLEFLLPQVAATRDGWVTSWTRLDNAGAHLRAARLAADGSRVGALLTPNDARPYLHREPGAPIVGLPTGSLVAWAERDIGPLVEVLIRRYDRQGRPTDLPVVVGPGVDHTFISLGAAPDGQVLVGWGWDKITADQREQAWVRAYEPAGHAIGEPQIVSDTAVLHAVAVSPLGDVAAAALSGPRDQEHRNQVSVRYLALDGTPLGDPVLVYQGGTNLDVRPTLGFDANGNLYVTWAETGGAIRARALGLARQPIGNTLTITDHADFGTVELAVLPDLGGFVHAWNERQPSTAQILVTSLCAPGSATCGDGVRDPLCERCDDGAANSDATADACRTDCRPARCGDGVVDSAETCDDGNHDDCDGCSAACAVEAGLGCGDGVAFPSCGETCDDANAIDGDGCSATCTIERVPGGGSPGTDCYTAWSIDNPANEPRFDRRGFSARQSCQDGDPRCDFDAGTFGTCTFHLQVCANNLDQPLCEPGNRLAEWQLRSPSATQAEGDPVLAAIRTALLGAVLPNIVGPEARDLCSPPIDVVVPLRGSVTGFKSRTIKLKTLATLYSGARDTDALALRCDPAAP